MEQMTIEKLLSLKSGDWVTKKDKESFLKCYQFIGSLHTKADWITTFFFYSNKFGYLDLCIYDVEKDKPDLEVKNYFIGKRD